MGKTLSPIGTTAAVNFTSSKPIRWQTAQNKCHLNWAICDSDWEAEFCRVAERPYGAEPAYPARGAGDRT